MAQSLPPPSAPVDRPAASSRVEGLGSTIPLPVTEDPPGLTLFRREHPAGQESTELGGQRESPVQKIRIPRRNGRTDARRRRLDRIQRAPGSPVGDEYLALHIIPPGRRLHGTGAHHPLVNVLIKIINRDLAVPVKIGITGTQSFQKCVGENGVQRVVIHRQQLAGRLVRIFLRPAGGEHRASLPFAAEGLPDRQAVTSPVRHHPGDRAAETAIEDKDYSARRGVIDQAAQQVCREGGDGDVGEFGIARGQVEPAGEIDNAVTGEMDQERVRRPRGTQEPAQRATHRGVRLADQRLDLIATDLRVREHLRQLGDVVDRRAQPAQARVLILARGDQQGEAGTHAPPAGPSPLCSSIQDCTSAC